MLKAEPRGILIALSAFDGHGREWGRDREEKVRLEKGMGGKTGGRWRRGREEEKLQTPTSVLMNYKGSTMLLVRGSKMTAKETNKAQVWGFEKTDRIITLPSDWPGERGCEFLKPEMRGVLLAVFTKMTMNSCPSMRQNTFQKHTLHQH